MVEAIWKTVWRFLGKLKIELSYNLAISLLGIYPDKTTKRHMHPYARRSTIHNTEDMGTT